jgi:stearoyl-CoA desaturase (delta-9 desaturase)
MAVADTPEPRPIYWENILFLFLTHVLGAAAIAYFSLLRCSWWTLGLTAAWFFFCALSISGGYHRLFAHRSYKSAWPFRAFHLFFGAASFQSSVLAWAADHREHHIHTDQDRDPYNIKKGFWWAHWGWLCYRTPEPDYMVHAKDLLADPLVVFQHRHYASMSLFTGMLLPMLIALAWGDPVGALLGAGFLRLLLQYHATFCINSWTHKFGRQPYSMSTSARDSFMGAILTLGEGYHNYHHTFPNDYRNGVRYYHFDPTKWVVWALSKIRVTWDLNRAPDPVIQRARETVLARHGDTLQGIP